MKNLNKRNKILMAALGAIVIVFIAFNFSDRIGGLFGGWDRGVAGVELYVPEGGAQVIVDGRRVQLTEKSGNVEIGGLSVGMHEIMVAKEGFWPWSKQIDLEEGGNEIGSFLVPSKPLAIPLTAGTAEHGEAQRLIDAATVPGKDRRLEHDGGRVAVWEDGDVIFAEWIAESDTPSFFCSEGHCSKRRRVLDSTADIKNLSFYKDREDVLVFATGDTVYAIEIDAEGTQNFQPIYEGADLRFAPSEKDDDVIYVRSEGRIHKVTM